METLFTFIYTYMETLFTFTYKINIELLVRNTKLSARFAHMMNVLCKTLRYYYNNIICNIIFYLSNSERYISLFIQVSHNT